MRRRITRALVAAAAAGATLTTFGLAAAQSASASVARPAAAASQVLGPTAATESAAGYEASGRYFRYIQALITVPDWYSSSVWPQEYIQLSNGSLNVSGEPTGDQYTRAGIEACSVAKKEHNLGSQSCKGHTWVAYIEAFNNSVFSPYFFHFVPLKVQAGDGVFFSIYYDQTGNELHYVIRPPTDENCYGSTSGSEESACYYKTRAYGPIFDHAAGLDDFTDTSGTPVPLPPFGHQFRINQFFQGALTTYSGARGSFVGPWTITKIEATSNGEVFPYGHVRVSPSYLWSDGMKANGAIRPYDAFGVWARV